MNDMHLLDGIRVIDFTQALSGPYCTLMLADLGADVIKIEAPRGDDARHWGPPFVGEDAAYFVSVNRNKRSVALDLKDPQDLRTARGLIATADVVVENWRPGTAERLGLLAADLRELNPGLVFCSISGFGQDQGPRSGYDQIVQGESGVMALTGPPGEPTKWGVPIADIAAGMFAATGVVAALLERTRTGKGRDVDVAMQDSLVSMLTHHAARYLSTGHVPPSDANGHATITPYGMFRTADGFVNICVGNDSQFQRMCEALDRPDLAEHPDYATNPRRTQHKEVLVKSLEQSLMSLSSTDVIAALDLVGVPVGSVSDIGRVLDGELASRRRMVLEFEREDSGRARVANTPWKIDGRAPGVQLPPPRLGEHTAELLAELAGIAAENISVGPEV